MIDRLISKILFWEHGNDAAGSARTALRRGPAGDQIQPGGGEDRRQMGVDVRADGDGVEGLANQGRRGLLK
ncbi:MAG: hypothetical protein HGA45_11515 [Chloroflexales bacterium]|nr:hypothetical protein [Chloroflexales bacterium]